MKKWVKDFYFLSLGTVVFTMPFPVEINNLALLFLFISWILLIIFGGGKEIVQNIKNNKVALLIILFALLYGLSAVLRIGSYEDSSVFFQNLELRSSYLFFPVVLSGVPLLQKLQVGNLFRLFVLSIFIATFICLTLSVVATFKTGSVYAWDSNISFVENYFIGKHLKKDLEDALFQYGEESCQYLETAQQLDKYQELADLGGNINE